VFSPDRGWEDLEQECDKRFLDTRVSETADSGDFPRGGGNVHLSAWEMGRTGCSIDIFTLFSAICSGLLAV